MSKLLILGASSSIGRRLYRTLGPEHAIGTFNRHPIPGGRFFDMTAMALGDIVRPGEADYAAILSADPDPDSCIGHPELSHRLNVSAMQSVLAECWRLNITPIFASTEFVFDGVKGNYGETDIAAPILLYGKQKKIIEDFLIESENPFACCRLAKVYGDQIGDGTLFSRWIAQLSSDVPVVRCASDQAFSPVFVGDVVAAIVAIARNSLTGLYHLSGNRRYRRDELLEMTIAAMSRRRRIGTHIERCSIDDFGLPENRPKDVSLCADKLASAIDIRYTRVEDCLESMLDAMHM
ncbi:MAG TPA: sugar nucleotide-binding protein [Rhodocyclaceae bacterium]|nr:sugar nucleotide-binding protein [Rhodocyclaceae bacterium]